MNLLEKYLRELHDIRATGSAVKETSYYPALVGLRNEVGKTLKQITPIVAHSRELD